MKTFCVPLINVSWLYWLTVQQLWSSFYFYPFSHKFFINFPVTCSSMGTGRGTVNMWKILIMIEWKQFQPHNFPEWCNVRNWRITAMCRFLKGISDCPLTLLIDLPHLERGCCTLRKNGLFAVGVMWKKEQGALFPSILVQNLSDCSEVTAFFWVHSGTPLNLIYSVLTQIISCCSFLWYFAVNVPFNWVKGRLIVLRSDCC